MPLTSSIMCPLGKPAPSFEVRDVTSGKMVHLDDFAGMDALVVMFLARHCPFTKYMQPAIAGIGSDYAGRAACIGICSSDISQHPEDAPQSLAEMAAEARFSFPLCFDETQKWAAEFEAACTPEAFVFDKGRRLAYRGRLGNNRPGVPPTSQELRSALDAVLSGQAVAADQYPGMGCNIKWKPGAEPAYVRGLTQSVGR